MNRHQLATKIDPIWYLVWGLTVAELENAKLHFSFSHSYSSHSDLVDVVEITGLPIL